MRYFKLILAILSIFISHIDSYAQSEWDRVSASYFTWGTNSNVQIDSRTATHLSFYNYHALTVDQKIENSFPLEVISMSLARWNESSAWKITFRISNNNNNPDYKYKVVDESGREKWHKKNVYWGFNINPYGKDSSYSISFGDCKSYPYFIESEDGGKNWDSSYHSAPLDISIEYNGESTIRVYVNSSLKHTFYNTRSIRSIDVWAGPAAWVCVRNFGAVRKTLYGNVKQYIENGDNKCRKEDYWGGVEEYTKAIDKGYVCYDIYYRRATAYYAMEFYNNTIDDVTEALSYCQNEDAYLLRGVAKLKKNDISGIDDLMMGGPRGLALVKEFGVGVMGEGVESAASNSKYTASGTGFFIDGSGYIATNYHVINGANGIDVLVAKDGKTVAYKAKSIVQDKTNDLAIIKIDDENFTNFTSIPYSIGYKTIDVGSSVFAMGYPELSYLGEEIKVTDGIISSKTGYQGDVTTYQISVPVQPGNSGGPLFDSYGNIVGIINAGIPSMQNVGYAIKVSYLNNLIDASPEVIQFSSSNKLRELPLVDKIKIISPFIVIIKVY